MALPRKLDSPDAADVTADLLLLAANEGTTDWALAEPAHKNANPTAIIQHVLRMTHLPQRRATDDFSQDGGRIPAIDFLSREPGHPRTDHFPNGVRSAHTGDFQGKRSTNKEICLISPVR